LEVRNAAQAREWLNAWGKGAFELNRAARLADDMDACRNLCPDCRGEEARGYVEAAEVLRKAVAAHEAAPEVIVDEAEVDRVLACVAAGRSPCCDAPLDQSRVVPTGRYKGHGPRLCSKCGVEVFRV